MITSQNRPGLPAFLRVTLKMRDGLGTRLPLHELILKYYINQFNVHAHVHCVCGLYELCKKINLTIYFGV